jgi:hypothetical protein
VSQFLVQKLSTYDYCVFGLCPSSSILKNTMFRNFPSSAAGLLLNLFFDPEHGGDMFLRNVGWHSMDYTALYPQTVVWGFLCILGNDPIYVMMSMPFLRRKSWESKLTWSRTHSHRSQSNNSPGVMSPRGTPFCLLQFFVWSAIWEEQGGSDTRTFASMYSETSLIRKSW